MQFFLFLTLWKSDNSKYVIKSQPSAANSDDGDYPLTATLPSKANKDILINEKGKAKA